MGVVVYFRRAALGDRATLVAGNLALRQQLAVLQVSMKRPKLRKRDRLFWVWLSRRWSGWRSCRMIVEPETVIRWHRQGFRLDWRWKSRRKLDPDAPLPRAIERPSPGRISAIPHLGGLHHRYPRAA